MEIGDRMKLLQKIYNKSNLKLLIISMVLFGLSMAIALPYFASLTAPYGDGPDTMLVFNLCPYYTARNNYGIEGVKLYVTLRWTFDLIWPIVYTFFYFMTISYLGKRVEDKIGYLWLLVPVLGVVFDLLENTFATIFMASYPNTINWAVHLLIISSTIKWIFVGGSGIVILYLIIKLVVKQYGKQKTNVS